MIEFIIGAAVIGGALLLGKNKNDGGSGSSDFDETFSDPGGFTPGSNPSKTDKVLQTAGQVIQTASAAAAALKAADFNFKKNPGNPAARAALAAARKKDNEARKAAAAAKRVAAQASKQASAAARQKQAKQPKPKPAPKPNKQEAAILQKAGAILKSIGVNVSSEIDLRSELKKMGSVGMAQAQKMLKAKGVKNADIQTLLRAAKIITK